MVREVKLYNVIFPIWLLLFFPPVIFITLAGNFIIDSLVVIICFFMFKLTNVHTDLKTFYKKSILKVWLFGFLADIVGAALMFVVAILGDSFGIPHELASAINFNPFSNAAAVCVIAFAMIVSGVLIFILNYGITFKQQIEDKHLRFKVALATAIITIPWSFLLPTKWFYSGF